MLVLVRVQVAQKVGAILAESRGDFGRRTKAILGKCWDNFVSCLHFFVLKKIIKCGSRKIFRKLKEMIFLIFDINF